MPTILLALVVGAAGVAASACSGIVEHQREVARQYCGAGWPLPDGGMAFPGDPQWPFEKHLCDGASPGEPATATTMR